MSTVIAASRVSFPTSLLQMSQLITEQIVALLQLLNLALQVFRLLLSAKTEFFNYLNDSPEAQNHNQGGDFLDDAVQDDIRDKAGDDDECVEAVEPRVEVTRCINTMWMCGICPGTYLQPNAQTEAISSIMNKHEKIKAMEPRMFKARSQSGPPFPCSHLKRLRTKSCKSAEKPFK